DAGGGGGPGGGEDPGEAVTPPGAPGSPAVRDVTSTSAVLAWSASSDTGGSGVAGYDVFLRAGTGQEQKVGSTTRTSFTLTGLEPDTTYIAAGVARGDARNVRQRSSGSSTPLAES